MYTKIQLFNCYYKRMSKFEHVYIMYVLCVFFLGTND